MTSLYQKILIGGFLLPFLTTSMPVNVGAEVAKNVRKAATASINPAQENYEDFSKNILKCWGLSEGEIKENIGLSMLPFNNEFYTINFTKGGDDIIQASFQYLIGDAEGEGSVSLNSCAPVLVPLAKSMFPAERSSADKFMSEEAQMDIVPEPLDLAELVGDDIIGGSAGQSNPVKSHPVNYPGSVTATNPDITWQQFYGGNAYAPFTIAKDKKFHLIRHGEGNPGILISENALDTDNKEVSFYPDASVQYPSGVTSITPSSLIPFAEGKNVTALQDNTFPEDLAMESLQSGQELPYEFAALWRLEDTYYTLIRPGETLDQALGKKPEKAALEAVIFPDNPGNYKYTLDNDQGSARITISRKTPFGIYLGISIGAAAIAGGISYLVYSLAQDDGQGETPSQEIPVINNHPGDL